MLQTEGAKRRSVKRCGYFTRDEHRYRTDGRCVRGGYSSLALRTDERGFICGRRFLTTSRTSAAVGARLACCVRARPQNGFLASSGSFGDTLGQHAVEDLVCSQARTDDTK